MKFINVGYGSLLCAERIILIANPDSAPVKRMIQDAKDDGRAIDLTCGKRTRSILLTDTDHIILSSLSPDKLAERAEDENKYNNEEQDEAQSEKS